MSPPRRASPWCVSGFVIWVEKPALYGCCWEKVCSILRTVPAADHPSCVYCCRFSAVGGSGPASEVSDPDVSAAEDSTEEEDDEEEEEEEEEKEDEEDC